MQRFSLRVAGVSLVLAIVALGSEVVAGSEEDIAAINKVREMEAETVNEAKTDSVKRIYAEDVESIPPGEAILKGSDAVQRWHTDLVEQYDVELKYTGSDIKVVGDWAIEQYAGVVTMAPKSGGESMTEHVRGIHVYRRGDDGAWKITHDIWNYMAADGGSD